MNTQQRVHAVAAHTSLLVDADMRASEGRGGVPMGVLSGVRLRPLGGVDVQSRAAVQVTEDRLHFNGVPLPKSLHSPWLGASPSFGTQCLTCGGDARTCPGHPGALQLPLPCLNPFLMGTVLDALKGTCEFCGRVKAAEDASTWRDTQHLQGTRRYHAVCHAVSNRRVCPHEGCRMHQPEYRGGGTSGGCSVQRLWSTGAGWRCLFMNFMDSGGDGAMLCRQLRGVNAGDVQARLAAVHPGDLLRLGVGVQGAESPETAWEQWRSAAVGGAAPHTNRHSLADAVMCNVHVSEPGLRPHVSTAEGSRRATHDPMTVLYKRLVREGKRVATGVAGAVTAHAEGRSPGPGPLANVHTVTMTKAAVDAFSKVLRAAGDRGEACPPAHVSALGAVHTALRAAAAARVPQPENGATDAQWAAQWAEHRDAMLQHALPEHVALLRVVGQAASGDMWAAAHAEVWGEHGGTPRGRKASRRGSDGTSTAVVVGEQLAPTGVPTWVAAMHALEEQGACKRGTVPPPSGFMDGDAVHALLAAFTQADTAAWSTLQECIVGHMTTETGAGGGAGGRPVGGGAARAGAQGGAPPGAASGGKSIAWLLKGKRGEIRGTLMGRRTDFSSRAVVSPRPDLALDEVTVPAVAVGATQTIREVVVTWADGRSPNADALRAAVLAGPGVLGGAAAVLRADGCHCVLLPGAQGAPGRAAAAAALGTGDTVERHLRDGDVALLNRQPTLHESSINAVRVRLDGRGDTLGLPLPAVTPYNADFDGDEMNLYTPQTVEAQAEAAVIMAMPNRVLSRATARPVVGAIQDTLVAAMLLTKPTTWVPAATAAAALAAGGVPLAAAPRMAPKGGVGPVGCTGAALLSAVLPRVTGTWPPGVRGGAPVVITDGTLVSGVLTKAHLGTSVGSLLHRVALQHGPRVASAFITALTRTLDAWVSTLGFSTGLSDVLPPAGTRAASAAAVAALVASADAVQAAGDAAAAAGALSPHAISTAERAVQKQLAGTMDAAHRAGAAGWLDACHNGMAVMSTSGAKGSSVNRTQCALVVGQQTVDGARLQPSAVGDTLLPFGRGASSCASRGFVASSYVDGASPVEVFHLARAGVSNLADTAVRTAVTGYMQRKLEAALQGVTVASNGTVRTSRGAVLMAVAGGDGMCPSKLERQALRALPRAAAHRSAAAAAWENAGGDAVDAMHAACDAAAHWCTWESPDAPRVPLPFNLPVTMQHAAAVQAQGGPPPTPTALASAVHLTAGALRGMLGSAPAAACVAALWTQCTPTEVHQLRLTPHSVHAVLLAALEAAKAALVAPGDALGALAAESIGEPSTQMTLNTFHSPGSNVAAVTEGVPRANELLNGERAAVSTPLMYLTPAAGAGGAHAVAAALPHTLLRKALLFVPTVESPASAYGSAVHPSAFAGALGLHSTPRGAPCVTLNLCVDTVAQAGCTPRSVAEACVQCAAAQGLAPLQYQCSGDLAQEWTVQLWSDAEGWDADAASACVAVLLDACSVRGDPCVSHAAAWAPPGADAAAGLTQVMALGQGFGRAATWPCVDWLRSSCNHAPDVLEHLGVAAAKRVLLEQFLDVMGGAGGKVDSRHLQLLCAWITHGGGITAATRNGINRVGNAPLREAAFEETALRLAHGAVSGTVDTLADSSSAIIMGAMGSYGTGRVGVEQNPSAAQHAVAASGAADFAHEHAAHSAPPHPHQSDVRGGAASPQGGAAEQPLAAGNTAALAASMASSLRAMAAQHGGVGTTDTAQDGAPAPGVLQLLQQFAQTEGAQCVSASLFGRPAAPPWELTAAGVAEDDLLKQEESMYF